MKENIEFLNYIYENARMGVVSIGNLLENVKDNKFKKYLNIELEEYKNICHETEELFEDYKVCEKDISTLTKVMTYMAIKISKNSGTKKFAKMMIEGSTKGIIAITEKINAYPDANAKIIKLAKKLLATEQDNIESLKEFL